MLVPLAVKVGAAAFDGDRDPLLAGVGHLAGDCPLPNQLEQAELIAVEFSTDRRGNSKRRSRRTNRLVSFLSVFDLLSVGADLRVQEVAAVFAPHQFPRRADRFFAERRAVGSHVGDVTVFIQPLSGLHRPPSGKTELAVGLLLQCAGCERGARPLNERLNIDGRHTKRRRPQPLGQRFGCGFIQQQQVAVLELAVGGVEIFASGELAAVDRCQRRRQSLCGGSFENRFQIPISRRPEGDPLAFPLDDQPHRDALHPAG